MTLTTGSETRSKFKIEIKYGLVIGLLTVVWLLAEFTTGLHNKHHELFLIVTNFVFIIPMVGIYHAISSKRKNHFGNHLTFGQGVLTGVIISVIYSLVAGLGQYLYHTVINPSYFDLMIKISEERGISTEQAAQYFNTASYVRGVVISYFVVGVLASLVHSVVLKRKPEEE